MSMEDVLSDVFTEPKLATIGSRIGAAVIDSLLLGIICVVFFVLWGVRDAEGSHLTGLPAFGLMAICFLAIPIQEGITGKTLGMRFFDIKVVRKNYTNVSVGQSIVRHFFDWIDWIFFVGLIVAATTPQRQRVGDLVAGTIVVVG